MHSRSRDVANRMPTGAPRNHEQQAAERHRNPELPLGLELVAPPDPVAVVTEGLTYVAPS